LSREILVPFIPELDLANTRFVIPKIGDRKKLLELSERNLKFYHLDKQKQESIRNRMPREERLLLTMQTDLNLPRIPSHIECFDNSNIQGTNPVAACVVFKNGKPSPSDYRHFNIKTVEGPNDFASMDEIVYRRYKRMIDEDQPLPQLIVIDGGKGQLGVAVRVLEELNILDKVSVIGLAKRLEEIFYPGDPVPLYLDKRSETLKVIQHIRNEAHRFGITFHRNQRSRNFIKSELEQIDGIGEKSINALLKHFKSVKNISSQSNDALAAVVGKAKASIVFNYFHPDSEEKVD